MLRYNMKQKLGKRERGARAVKSMEPGFHFVPSLLQGENGFPDGGYLQVFLGGSLGSPKQGTLGDFLFCEKNTGRDCKAIPRLNSAFLKGQVPLVKQKGSTGHALRQRLRGERAGEFKCTGWMVCSVVSFLLI